MNQLGQRLWNTSLGSLSRAIARRLDRSKDQPGWHKVAAGPLAGLELFLPQARRGAFQEMAAGTFDDFLYSALLARRDLKGAVCWDIGAHFGYHSLGFAALGAEVLSFEPNTHNARHLKMHLERNASVAARVRHMPEALCEQDGQMTFTQSSDMGGESSGSHLDAALPPLGDACYATFSQVTVPTARIDTLIEERGEKAPDVLKIDVEGAEALVLRGGERFLSSRRPLILMEVHHIRLMMEVSELLLRWGYRLELLDPAHSTASRCFIMALPASN